MFYSLCPDNLIQHCFSLDNHHLQITVIDKKQEQSVSVQVDVM